MKINVQEVYLLERYSSLEYFAQLRETWGKMIEHVENCLQSYLSDLPAKYRSTPLPEQADIVWGHRILPNFRDTMQGLHTGFIMLTHGDFRGLHCAHGPINDSIGQRRDYSPDWMSVEDRNVYEDLLEQAAKMAGHITATEGAYWQPLDLTNYVEELKTLPPLAELATYRINQKVSVRVGAKTPQSGIYVPDVENSCAQFLSTYYNEAPHAYVVAGFRDLLDPRTGEKYDEEPILEEKDCTWYLVECASASEDVPQSDIADPAQLMRVAAGQPCPEAGFYFTPARANSRKLFKQGEIMPDLGTDYGTTIWQWDAKQE
jgi:hypothetical protein